VTDAIDHADFAAGAAFAERGLVRRYPLAVIGAALLALVLLITAAAPLLATHDPLDIDPTVRLRAPSVAHVLGTDALGRDVWSRTVFGGRVSLMVGFVVSLFASAVGLGVGLLTGYSRIADALLMRIMDGLMAMPAILLAIALMAVMRASLLTVIMAITVVEIPRVVRVVRSVVLTVRAQTYVEAAIIVGTRPFRVLSRHILPNSLAPLIVQATYICAAAMLVESILSFLGAGTPPEIPSWGNIMAEGRTYFQIAPWLILSPGVLRSALDPRISRGL
jgi:peptide/nickel transport system permease protein